MKLYLHIIKASFDWREEKMKRVKEIKITKHEKNNKLKNPSCF